MDRVYQRGLGANVVGAASNHMQERHRHLNGYVRLPFADGKITVCHQILADLKQLDTLARDHILGSPYETKKTAR